MTDMNWPKPEKPEGITEWEWQTYMNSSYRSISPELKAKVHHAMGWQINDVEDAEEIAGQVVEAMDKLSREQGWDKDRPVGPVVVERLRAALRLLENEHITPQGRRLLEQILDEEEKRA